MKYHSKIVAIGSDSYQLIEEANCLVVFNDTLQDELLKSISWVHKASNLTAKIEKGDELIIGKNILKIVAVGNVAQETFKNIGHFTIRFENTEQLTLIGDINVCGKIEHKINIGDEFIIKKGKE